MNKACGLSSSRKGGDFKPHGECSVFHQPKIHESVLSLKISAGRTLCSGLQVSHLHRSCTPQVNCGCSDVAAESRSAQLRELFHSETALKPDGMPPWNGRQHDPQACQNHLDPAQPHEIFQAGKPEGEEYQIGAYFIGQEKLIQPHIEGKDRHHGRNAQIQGNLRQQRTYGGHGRQWRKQKNLQLFRRNTQ